MLEFAYPWLFLILPLPVLLWWFSPPHRQRVSAIRVPFFQEILAATGEQARPGSLVLRRKMIQVTGMSVIWILLVTAAAKPQWVGEPIVRTEAARDVMLALDLSGSMDKSDFPDGSGNNIRRFDAVKEVVLDFIAARKDDRIGMIVFGDRAYVQLPFTRDLKTAETLVELVDVGMAGQQTAIGDAIGLAIRSFESSEVDQRILILLSDGSDTASKMTPLNAADIATQNQVTIFTIGMGDPEGVGEDKVDFDTLDQVATRTGGQFFVAQDQPDLADIYSRIDQVAEADLKTESWRPRESLVHWPAGAAMLFGLSGYLLLILMRWVKNRRGHYGES